MLSWYQGKTWEWHSTDILLKRYRTYRLFLSLQFLLQESLASLFESSLFFFSSRFAHFFLRDTFFSPEKRILSHPTKIHTVANVPRTRPILFFFSPYIVYEWQLDCVIFHYQTWKEWNPQPVIGESGKMLHIALWLLTSQSEFLLMLCFILLSLLDVPFGNTILIFFLNTGNIFISGVILSSCKHPLGVTGVLRILK